MKLRKPLDLTQNYYIRNGIHISNEHSHNKYKIYIYYIHTHILGA